MEQQKLWNAVDEFFEEKLVPERSKVFGGTEQCREWNMPDMNVSALQGKFLQLLVRMNRASRVLEIGTFFGYSSIWMGMGLPENGIIKTIDFKDDFVPEARENIAKAGLADKIEVIFGDAGDILQEMVAEGEQPFDLVFMDADKPRYAEFLELILKLSKPGTVIITDNVVREGEIVNKETHLRGVHGVWRYLDALVKTDRLESTAMQTVGVKGYDGMIISYVK